MRTVGPGTLVYSPGTDPPRLLLVLQGRLRTFQQGSDRRRVLFTDVEAGGLDGILTVGGHPGHFAQAERRSLVAFVSREQLDALVAAVPQLAYNLVWVLTERLQTREVQLRAVTLRDPTQRLARILLDLADQTNPDAERVNVRRRPTHQALADMLGLRRETVTIHLQALREAGAITRSGRGGVLDRRLLARIADSGLPTPAGDEGASGAVQKPRRRAPRSKS